MKFYLNTALPLFGQSNLSVQWSLPVLFAQGMEEAENVRDATIKALMLFQLNDVKESPRQMRTLVTALILGLPFSLQGECLEILRDCCLDKVPGSQDNGDLIFVGIWEAARILTLARYEFATRYSDSLKSQETIPNLLRSLNERRSGQSRASFLQVLPQATLQIMEQEFGPAHQSYSIQKRWGLAKDMGKPPYEVRERGCLVNAVQAWAADIILDPYKGALAGLEPGERAEDIAHYKQVLELSNGLSDALDKHNSAGCQLSPLGKEFVRALAVGVLLRHELVNMLGVALTSPSTIKVQ